MLHSIGNECLTLKVDSLGAQMTELSSCCENQFLWDGDPAYWNGRAPCLFPYVGRLTDNTYMLHGKKYSMGIHGFAWTSELRSMNRGRVLFDTACLVILIPETVSI